MSDVHVVYHGNCSDGFGAAWATHQALGDQAIYHEGFYGADPPELGVRDSLFIFDFSYSREVMEELQRQHPGRVILVDHHQTAREVLSGLEDCYFDLDHSGAYLAWKAWFGETREVPVLLQYVEDRDLWKWELSSSRAVSAALNLEAREFVVWDQLDVLTLKQEGEVILRAQRQQVKRLVELAEHRDVGGQVVPVVNTPLLQSEVCERLLQTYERAPFAGAYYEARDSSDTPYRNWSLRSRADSEVDVSAVAKQFGGGGHMHAAGFRALNL